MQSRAPQAASCWHSGPRCRLGVQHTPWPADTRLWMWSPWNWTQSDTKNKVTSAQKEVTDTRWTWWGSHTFYCSTSCFQTSTIRMTEVILNVDKSLILNPWYFKCNIKIGMLEMSKGLNCAGLCRNPRSAEGESRSTELRRCSAGSLWCAMAKKL